ncbi:MAG TPA: peptidase, partial [Gammaproteobacteria bacterium]|nr:peptidase [Gammaproteobacteria bacterium]
GKQAYSAGYRVFTTIDSRLQEAADRALRNGLLSYIRRHGYPGPERHLDLPAAELTAWLRSAGEPDSTIPPAIAKAQHALQQIPVLGGLHPALVVEISDDYLTAWLAADQQLVRLPHTGFSWALKRTPDDNDTSPPKRISDLLRTGDVIRIRNQDGKRWELAALPQTEGALVSLDPESGAITALSGGFDFFHSKFNRATQAQRQPGSAFKPFIYSAALNKGYTAASIINDAPIVMDDENLDERWKPRNYSGRFFGPTRLRVALTKSRNLVSIRLLRSIGVGYAAKYATRFGFRSKSLPRDLSLALGSGSVTPLELATGYTVFANGGYLISPYLIQRIENAEGEIIWQETPLRVCQECETATGDGKNSPSVAKRVITPQNAYLMTSMMRDVIRYGTGHRAMELKRNDLAGKTGTTNDQFDAWFSGFNHAVVATVWTGFDTPRPMGNRETGGRAALPIWMEFMRTALDGIPEVPLKQPPGLVTVRIDPENGLLANASTPKTIFETFRSGHVPEEQPETYWESSEENSKGLSELF